MFYRLFLFVAICFCYSDVWADNLIKGDTYTMQVHDGWVPGTTEKYERKIGRRMIDGYQVTYSSRINMQESCSVEVLEYLNCYSGRDVMVKDSLVFASGGRYVSIVWGKEGVAQRYVEMCSVPMRHPETRVLESVRAKSWYIQGKKAFYVITFSADDEKVYHKWVGQVSSWVLTLKETSGAKRK